MKTFLLGIVAGAYCVPLAIVFVRKLRSLEEVQLSRHEDLLIRHLRLIEDEEAIRHEDLVNHLSRISISVRDNQRPFDFRGAL